MKKTTLLEILLTLQAMFLLYLLHNGTPDNSTLDLAVITIAAFILTLIYYIRADKHYTKNVIKSPKRKRRTPAITSNSYKEYGNRSFELYVKAGTPIEEIMFVQSWHKSNLNAEETEFNHIN